MKQYLVTILVAVIIFFSTGIATCQDVDNIANVEFRLDERVFTVMCAIHIAGYDFGLDREHGDSIRLKVLADLKKLDIDPEIESRLKDFYRRHNVEMDVSRQQPKYVSFSLLLGAPPHFTFRPGAGDPPPQIYALKGFEELLAVFYEDAQIAELWQKWKPEFVRRLLKTRDNLKTSILDVLDYARVPARLYLNRRLIITPDPVDASNSVNVVHRGGNYYIFVSSTLEPERYRKFFVHEYLHYLLDPIFDKVANEFARDEHLIDFISTHDQYAAFVDDKSMLVRKSVINAVQLAVQSDSGQIRSKLRAEMIRRNSPFLPYFEELLNKYEKSKKTLPEFFAAELEKTTSKVLIASYVPPPPETGKEELEGKTADKQQSDKQTKREHGLEKAGRLIQDGRLDDAESILADVLAASPADPNALFGMGQARYARKDFEGALGFYEKVLSLTEIPVWVKAWSLVKSGNCLVHLNKWERASEIFKKAADIKGEDRGAAQAAERALKQISDQKLQNR